MSSTDQLILVLYALLSVVIAFSVRRAKSVNEFSFAGKNIPGVIVFATLSATLIGPGYSMGVVNRAYGGGFIWFFIFLAFSLQTITFGRYVVPKIRDLPGVNTIADIFKVKYGRKAQLLTGIISFVSLVGFFAAIAGATGDIVHALTGYDRSLSIYTCVGFVIIYASIGGIKSVILTDTFQFAVLIIAIPIAFLILLNNDLPASTQVNELLVFNQGMSWPMFFGLFISFFFGEALIPPYVHRVIISKNSTEAQKGYVSSGVFSIIWFFICVFIGCVGISVYPNSDNLFLDILKTKLPTGITGIAVAAMISIILSTLSSLLNSATVTLNEDLVKFFRKKWDSSAKEVWFLRLSSVVIGLISIFFALRSPGIIDGLLIVYSLWGSSVVLPLVLGLVLKKVKPLAGLAGMLSGIIVTIVWKWGLAEPYELPAIVPGILANALVYTFLQTRSGNTTNFSS